MSAHEEEYESNAEFGFEDGPEANKIIWISGILSVLTLIVIIPGFHSYFNDMFGDAHDTVRTNIDADGDDRVDYLAERNDRLADHRARLSGAPVSISDAMANVARSRGVAPVRPNQNDSIQAALPDALSTLAAVEGWTQLADEDGKGAAETALMMRRAAALSAQLERSAQQAVDLGLQDDAARSRRLGAAARNNPTAESLGAAEEWLRGWPTRRQAAATPVGAE